MTTMPHLALPLLAAAQAQKHVAHNEALAALDALVHLSVPERRGGPPATPGDGARYLVAEPASGAFANQAGRIALFELGAWRFLVPRPGWRAYVEAENRLVVFDGALWRDLAGLLRELDAVERLGIGTAPDAQNPLSAKLNAALFAARGAGEGGTGDLRITVNKEGAARTASYLFQSGYSGRAEFGLVGDDDFRLKVSGDGTAWTDALRVNRATGGVVVPVSLTVAGQVPWTNALAPRVLNANGYHKLPSGLILQWGSGGGTGADPAIVFPLAFPAACRSVVATCRVVSADPALVACAVDLVTTTGFTARPRFAQSGGTVAYANNTFNWFAVGH